MAISPRCSVTMASAGSSVNGSNEVAVALRLSASIGMLSTARWSAMKKASNLPALQRLGEALEMREIEVRIGQRARIAPGGGMDADGPHESAEAQLTRVAHGQLTPDRCVWTSM